MKCVICGEETGSYLPYCDRCWKNRQKLLGVKSIKDFTGDKNE